MSSYNPIEPQNGDYEALIKNLENQKLNNTKTSLSETLSEHERHSNISGISNAANNKKNLGNSLNGVKLNNKNNFDNKKFFKTKRPSEKISNNVLKKIFTVIAFLLFISLNFLFICLGNVLNEEFFFFLSACSFIFAFAFISNYKQRQKKKKDTHK